MILIILFFFYYIICYINLFAFRLSFEKWGGGNKFRLRHWPLTIERRTVFSIEYRE